MTETIGAREKKIATQTLAPFLKSLVGQVTFVELRNGNQVNGVIVATDCFMNVTMENAIMSNCNGILGKFPFFFIHNKFITTINIPHQVDASRELINQVDIATGAKRRRELKAARERRARFLQKKELRRQVTETS